MKHDTQLERLLRNLKAAVLSHPIMREDLRESLRAVLVFLASPKGRTDANCRAVDFSITNDEEIWAYIDNVEAVDEVAADVLRDMAGALHDTVSAPGIAANFESTPEQLLKRLE
jgi:hypothetical protein